MTEAKPFRIGTWNLDRTGISNKHRIEPQIDLLSRHNADVWVLTEAHESNSIEGYNSLASICDPNYHQLGESCVAIRSRLPMRTIPEFTSDYSVCCELQSPFGPMIVNGTIITYADDGVREGIAKKWELHRKAVQQQVAEWKKLHELYPKHMLCVAGDFNMNLDGRRWYGVKDAREAVLSGLNAAGMYCATRADLQGPQYELSRSTVSHICLSSNISTDDSLVVWEGGDLSDHNGLLVTLKQAST